MYRKQTITFLIHLLLKKLLLRAKVKDFCRGGSFFRGLQSFRLYESKGDSL